MSGRARMYQEAAPGVPSEISYRINGLNLMDLRTVLSLMRRDPDMRDSSTLKEAKPYHDIVVWTF